MGSYYCLVAGLPDIGFEDGKMPLSIDAFRNELSEVLTVRDMELVKFVDLAIDNRNLLAVLNNRDVEIESDGNFDKEYLLRVIEDLEDEDRPNKIYIPKFWETYYRMMYSEDEVVDGVDYRKIKSAEDIMSMLYYQEGIRLRNGFMANWFEFSLNVNNIITALTVRKYGLEGDYIVGNNRIARKLRGSSARDFGLSTEIDYFDTVVRIFEESDILVKERKIDVLRWDWIENRAVYEYFSISRVMAYFLELQMLERWSKLDKSVGEERFRSIIDGFKQGVKNVEVF